MHAALNFKMPNMKDMAFMVEGKAGTARLIVFHSVHIRRIIHSE